MSGLDPRFMQHIVVLLILSRQGSMGGGGGKREVTMHACMHDVGSKDRFVKYCTILQITGRVYAI